MITSSTQPALASASHLWRRFGHVLLAFGLTLLLLVFLVFARWLSSIRDSDQVIRLVEVMPSVALPAPPPPPSQSDDVPRPDRVPPPPPVEVLLPKLDLQIEAVATPLKARLRPQVDVSMTTAVFDLEVDPVAPPTTRSVGRVASATPRATSSSPPKPASAPAMKSSYDAAELDATPRLVNRPSASYPRDQLRAGVKEGRVLLEVSISTSGRVSVRRVISSSHSDFTTMARTFASRARFTVPKKNGRPVTAIYRWPLILRP